MNAKQNQSEPSAAMQAALRLESLTIVWMLAEAFVSIGAGLAAGSVLLLTFGADSMIELVSAIVLLHRLRQEAHDTNLDEREIEALEHRAARIAGYLLYALAVYVVLQSGYGLLHRLAAETSWLGIAVALAAAFGMPILAKAKIRAADRIESKALRADAMETFTCGYLSWILLAGLAANALLHWWWLDSVAALALVPFLIKEGREAMTGEGCC
jgi:divalent metal cation (Fe/Co/Zn/Cd) transporter